MQYERKYKRAKKIIYILIFTLIIVLAYIFIILKNNESLKEENVKLVNDNYSIRRKEEQLVNELTDIRGKYAEAINVEKNNIVDKNLMPVNLKTINNRGVLFIQDGKGYITCNGISEEKAQPFCTITNSDTFFINENTWYTIQANSEDDSIFLDMYFYKNGELFSVNGIKRVDNGVDEPFYDNRINTEDVKSVSFNLEDVEGISLVFQLRVKSGGVIVENKKAFPCIFEGL